MNKKGFTLVELMVVVAIIAILAAVGLPMYSTFKQKARVGTVLKAVNGATGALQSHFQETLSFTGMTLSEDTLGGALMIGDLRVGAGLPEVPDGSWALTVVDADSVTFDITWAASAGCPSANCDTRYCLNCSAQHDKCYIGIVVGGATDPLGMNEQQGGAADTCTM